VSRFTWAVLAALTLAGCAVAPRAPEGGVSPDPGTLQQWTASGRMAIAAGNDGGSGSFTWTQDAAETRLDLRGPLGTGAVRLVVTPGALSLADGAGQTLDAEAARAELRSRLGADLPWGQLRYWMLGLADPGEAAVVQEADAAPWRVIEQSGWRLAYQSFAKVQGVNVPQRFSAERDSIRVRVIVDTWSASLPSGEASEARP
jgi:outer membrane lipoprotein LolB